MTPCEATANKQDGRARLGSVRLFAMLGTAAQLLRVNPLFVFSPKSPSSSSSLPSRPQSARCPMASHARDFPPASRIFVSNLSYSISESSLKSVFSDFGQIAEVKLARDVNTKKSKGYGFVQYCCQDDALLAMEQVDGKIIEGRAISVEIAKPINDKFAGSPISTGPPAAEHREAKRVK